MGCHRFLWRWASALAFPESLAASGRACLTAGHLLLRLSVFWSLAQPCPTLPSVLSLGFAPAFLRLLLSSLTFSSASSLYFQHLLLASHIFPDAHLPLFFSVGATQGSFIPLLAQVSGVGLYIITFTMLLNDCKAFSSRPPQFQIYSNQDFMLTTEHTSY